MVGTSRLTILSVLRTCLKNVTVLSGPKYVLSGSEYRLAGVLSGLEYCLGWGLSMLGHSLGWVKVWAGFKLGWAAVWLM